MFEKFYPTHRQKVVYCAQCRNNKPTVKMAELVGIDQGTIGVVMSKETMKESETMKSNSRERVAQKEFLSFSRLVCPRRMISMKMIILYFLSFMLEAYVVANEKRPLDSFGTIEPLVENKTVYAEKESASTPIPPKLPKIDRCVLNKEVKSPIWVGGRKVGEKSIMPGTVVKIEKIYGEKILVSGNNMTIKVPVAYTDYPTRKARLEQFSFIRPCLEELSDKQLAARLKMFDTVRENRLDDFLRKEECDATSLALLDVRIVAEEPKKHMIKFELLIADWFKVIKKVNCEHDDRALISIQLRNLAKTEGNKGGDSVLAIVRLRKTKLLGVEVVDFMSVKEFSSLSTRFEKRDQFAPTNISPAMFKADINSFPVVVAAVTKISDYYNYEFADLRADYWSVRIEASTGNKYETENFYGYVSKDSELGKRIRESLQDGKDHAALVKLAHPKNAESSDCCLILAFKLL